MTTIANKRKRGAQPGNQNGRKHGLYSNVLSSEQKEYLSDFMKLTDSLDQGIDAIRRKMRYMVDNNSPDNEEFLFVGSLLVHLLRLKYSHDGRLFSVFERQTSE